MDIASVYLNLASLLGTEIEVEGYHFGGVLYNVEGDQRSLAIALPLYLVNAGVVNLNYALHGAGYWANMTLRGRLTQNRQGELLLDLIDSIRYTNTVEHMTYQATLTYEKEAVKCAIQADLSVHGRQYRIENLPHQNTTRFASQHLSNIVLLEGHLLSPHRYNGNLSARISNLVVNWRDWIEQIGLRLLDVFVATPLVFWGNLRLSGLKRAVEIYNRGGGWTGFESVVWIQDEDNAYLYQFFAPLIPGGYSNWDRKFIPCLFVGQLAYLDGDEETSNTLYRRYKLKFASLHHVRLNHTITIQRPQDERL